MNSTLSNNFVVERGDNGGEYVADEITDNTKVTI